MQKWTEKELKILQDKFPISLKADICRLIPNKTYCAIKTV